jgi:hypothetical protein
MLKLITEPDFSRKSAEPSVFTEETKADIGIKLNYIRAHLIDLIEYQNTLKMNRAVERLEHGKPRVRHATGVNRRLNTTMWSTLIAHITLMEAEQKRLTMLYNA